MASHNSNAYWSCVTEKHAPFRLGFGKFCFGCSFTRLQTELQAGEFPFLLPCMKRGFSPEGFAAMQTCNVTCVVPTRTSANLPLPLQTAGNPAEIIHILTRWCAPEVLRLIRTVLEPQIEKGNDGFVRQCTNRLIESLNSSSAISGGRQQVFLLASVVLRDLLRSVVIAPLVVEALVQSIRTSIGPALTNQPHNALSLLTSAIQSEVAGQRTAATMGVVVSLLLTAPAPQSHALIHTLVVHCLLSNSDNVHHTTRAATLLLLQALSAAHGPAVTALLLPRLHEVLQAALDVSLRPHITGSTPPASAPDIAASTAAAAMRLVCNIMPHVDARNNRQLNAVLVQQFVGVLLPHMVQLCGDSNKVSSCPLVLPFCMFSALPSLFHPSNNNTSNGPCSVSPARLCAYLRLPHPYIAGMNVFEYARHVWTHRQVCVMIVATSLIQLSLILSNRLYDCHVCVG
jgi:hypothetical protein